MHRHTLRRWLLVSCLAAAALTTSLVLRVAHGEGGKDDKPAKLALALDAKPLPDDLKAKTSFAPMLKRAAASVVKVYTSKVVRQRAMPDFPDPMFRRFFDERFGGGGPQKMQGLGSGVIITTDGYVVTNNHVVDGADEVKVAVGKGDKEYTARVIGTDPKTDVALIKIDGDGLPALPVGDSDLLEVGDRVFAIGNPMGVGETCTSGIVSAVGRSNLGINEYENFIQTDAAINRGNSGGALVDAEGRLVGLNSVIISSSGGSQGIGLAVPSNLMRNVIERLLAGGGKVVRGFLGITIQAVTADNQKFFNLKEAKGAIVGDVAPGSAAAEAGIQKGDVIVSIADKEVSDPRTLRFLVEQTAPGQKIDVKYIRDGKPNTVTATVKELPDDPTVAAANGEPVENGGALRGVELTPLTPQIRKELDLPAEVKGVAVREVRGDSPAAGTGLEAGSVIAEINRHPVASVREALRAASEAKGGDLLLYVWSKDRGGHFLVLPGQKDGK